MISVTATRVCREKNTVIAKKKHDFDLKWAFCRTILPVVKRAIMTDAAERKTHGSTSSTSDRFDEGFTGVYRRTCCSPRAGSRVCRTLVGMGSNFWGRAPAQNTLDSLKEYHVTWVP